MPLVLVVDDDASVREFFGNTLTSGGYAVASAATAEDALAMLPNEPRPTAILLDLRMPGMGGLAFLMCLRADPQYRDMPVAVITGDATVPPSMWTSIEALDVEICFKPLDMEAILTLVRRLVRRRPRRRAASRPDAHA